MCHWKEREMGREGKAKAREACTEELFKTFLTRVIDPFSVGMEMRMQSM